MTNHFSVDATLVVHAESLAQARRLIDKVLDNLSGADPALVAIESEDVQELTDYDCLPCKQKAVP